VNIDWSQLFYDEWSFIAFVTGFVCVLLITFARWPRLSWWNWPLGFISTVIWTWILYDQKLYASAALNLFFAGSALYGAWAWKRGNEGFELPIQRATKRIVWNEFSIPVYAVATVFTALFTGIAYVVLDTWTANPEPFWDAAFVGVSIAAQFIMTRRYLEHWYLWILSDIIAVPLYWSQGLKSLAVLYFVYGILCVWPGLVEWMKRYSREQTVLMSTNPLLPVQTGVESASHES
jgi:nicotinamide mononucleotide transporter